MTVGDKQLNNTKRGDQHKYWVSVLSFRAPFYPLKNHLIKRALEPN